MCSSSLIFPAHFIFLIKLLIHLCQFVCSTLFGIILIFTRLFYSFLQIVLGHLLLSRWPNCVYFKSSSLFSPWNSQRLCFQSRPSLNFYQLIYLKIEYHWTFSTHIAALNLWLLSVSYILMDYLLDYNNYS